MITKYAIKGIENINNPNRSMYMVCFLYFLSLFLFLKNSLKIPYTISGIANKNQSNVKIIFNPILIISLLYFQPQFYFSPICFDISFSFNAIFAFIEETTFLPVFCSNSNRATLATFPP